MQIKLRDMRQGTRFRCGSGATWIKGREHGSHHDVYLARRELDGAESCFGGNIEFEEVDA